MTAPHARAFKVTLEQLLANFRSSTKKKLVSGITCLFPAAVTKVTQEGLPSLEIVRTNEDPHHNPTHIGSMISVVENADAPVAMQSRDEAH
jgi:flagellar motor component MotA